jgi:dolichol-phosphate mannosyltransferase
MPSISIVVPLFNEALSLVDLHGEIKVMADRENLEWEMIFVDDGSTDSSWQTISDLAEKDRHVSGLRFRKNFGKSSAISAGADAACAPILVTIDADLQDVPAEIPKMLAALRNGLDLVSGWKASRKDSRSKRFSSRVFNGLVTRLSGVQLHDHNCGLKVMRREVLQQIRLTGGMHRFLTILAAESGFRVGEVIVAHRSRLHGKSKYGWTRLPAGLFDLCRVVLFKKAILKSARSSPPGYIIAERVGRS